MEQVPAWIAAGRQASNDSSKLVEQRLANVNVQNQFQYGQFTTTSGGGLGGKQAAYDRDQRRAYETFV